MPEKEWILLSDAADELKVTPERVRQFIYEGRLEAKRMGHFWVVERKELIQFKKLPRRTGNPGKAGVR